MTYHKNIKAPPDGQSFSPWAERIGLSAACLEPAFQRGPLFHSGYAPEQTLLTVGLDPRIDALYYADKPDISNTGTFHDKNEIDKVFFADEQRPSMFSGVELWQIGPLLQSLKFSDRIGSIPGGNRRPSPDQIPKSIAELVSQGEMIAPDDQSWFGFFKKDRWCDGHVAVPLLGNQPWSIDHPEVGFYMGIILELANRMLGALIEEKHPFITTLLFGYIGDWTQTALLLNPSIADNIDDSDSVLDVEGELVLLSYDRYEKDRDTCHPDLKDLMEQSIQQPPDTYRAKLEDLLRDHQWGFMTGEEQGSYGVTHTSMGGVITLNAEPLAILLESRATSAERCLRIFQIAAVILHELSHAIMLHRLESTYGRENIGSEPYVDFKGATEIGFEFEQAVIGAVIGSIDVDLNRISLGLTALRWPFPWIDSPRQQALFECIKGHEDFYDGKIIEMTVIPAEFASKLLSEEFWKDITIPRKTDNYFHRKPIFISRFPNEKSKPLAEFRTPLGIDPSLDPNLLSLSEKNMIESWRENEDLVIYLELFRSLTQTVLVWNNSRASWYQRLRDVWDTTAWCMSALRVRIAAFEYAHKEKDLGRCSAIANSMVQRVKWNEEVSTNEYASEVQQPEWVFHVLGLLMFAALPIQDEDEVIQKRGFAASGQVVELPPSSTAIGKPSIKVKKENWQPAIRVRASKIFNPILRPHEAITRFTQTNYLDLVTIILRIFAVRKKSVPTGWLNEIMRVQRTIQEARQAMRSTITAQSERRKSWAGVWDFKVPPYDPDDTSRWDGQQSAWVRAPP
ncbi:hypothetical protein F4678DRAFT_479385 [Xylaria arbuscula]|nr:hypothetical protein F4678DRAFT_479385 [Xylaria arbuscula]